jgi:hypothetical protein
MNVLNTVRKPALALAALLATAPVAALNINLIDSSVADPAQTLLDALVAPGSGVTVVPGSVNFIGRVGDGNLAQSATYSNFNLAPAVGNGPTVQIDDGIFLTSGVANIPLTNTREDWSHGAPGISQPDTGSNALLSALSGSSTFDQNVLQFQFTLDNPNDNAVNIEIVFGSDEYPTQEVTDIFGFFIDGENFAFFEDGSLIANNPATDFIDNPVGSGLYNVEYNGITRTLTITGLVDPEAGPHTAVIAIADTTDPIYDSGVFVANFRATEADDGGIGPPPPPPPPVAPVAVPSMNLGGSLIFILMMLVLGLFATRMRP